MIFFVCGFRAQRGILCDLVTTYVSSHVSILLTSFLCCILLTQSTRVECPLCTSIRLQYVDIVVCCICSGTRQILVD